MKRTIYRRLLSNLSLILLLTLIAGGFGVVSLVNTQRRSRGVIRQSLKVQEASRKMTDNLLEARRAEKEFLLTGQGDYAVIGHMLAVYRTLAAFPTGGKTEGTSEIASLTEEYCKGFRAVARKIGEKGWGDQGLNASLNQKGRFIEEAVIRTGLMQLMADLLTIRSFERDYLLYQKVAAYQSLTNAIPSFQADVNRAHIAASLKSGLIQQIEDWWQLFTRLAVLDDRIFKRSLSIMAVLLLGCLIIGFSVTILVARKLSRPIVALSAATTKVAQGDLNATVLIETGDEIEELGNSFNQMTRNLRDSRRKLEDYSRKLEDYSRTLEQRVAERTAEIQQRNEEIKQFAYIVSHDLRAPLVNLKGFSSELRSALDVIGPAMDTALSHLDEAQRSEVTLALEEDIPEALDFIASSVTRMDEFINAVLKLSRLGRRELQSEPLDMNALVEETLKTLTHQIEERGVRVTVGHLPEVVADRTSMEQIMGNLLNNAIIYLDPDRAGEIDIAAERGEKATTFRVRDNGRGISEEDMSKVFAPFRRAGKQDVSGEGMGLSHVQTLVRRHGGRIWFESEPGVGTTFIFTLSNHLEKGDKDAD
jgi:signal transduction histidine kinase